MKAPSLALAVLVSAGTGLAPRVRAAEARTEAGSAEEKTRSVIAGRASYDRSGYYKLHFGEGYRKLWTTPFAAPVLDFETFAGGLVPVRQVGSMQSIGLALKGADGKSGWRGRPRSTRATPSAA